MEYCCKAAKKRAGGPRTMLPRLDVAEIGHAPSAGQGQTNDPTTDPKSSPKDGHARADPSIDHTRVIRAGSRVGSRAWPIGVIELVLESESESELERQVSPTV